MCDNCEHKPVCSKYRATGGVKTCAHHREGRRGQWKEGYLIHKYGCSCCWARQDKISPYCPNCGADMRGEET